MSKRTPTAARPTTYRGIEMRSRLEAGCAQILDNSFGPGTWDYEPRAYADETGQYLPDFYVAPYFFWEVRPPSISVQEAVAALKRMHIIRSSEPHAILFVAAPLWEGGRWESFKGLLNCVPVDHPWTPGEGCVWCVEDWGDDLP
jgi:hypothetical protein